MSIVVVGEFMLDVLIDRLNTPKLIAGGAGTVVRAAKNLTSQVNVVGWLRDSFVNRKICNLLAVTGSELFVSRRKDGCQRIRIHLLSGGSKNYLFRLDRVGPNFNAGLVENRILKAISLGDSHKILVISDFGKAGASVDIKSRKDLTYGLALIGSKSSLHRSLPRSVLITSASDRSLSPANNHDLLQRTRQLMLLRNGPVILTGSHLGAAYVSAEEEYFIPASPVQNIFEVGAGDWLLGCMAAMLNDGFTMRAALTSAIDMATETVGKSWVGLK